MAYFLVIHGLENHRPEGHWHRILTAALREAGHHVAYPQLPNPDAPALDEWLDVLNTELHIMAESGASELTVIAHSLGCVTWLQYITRYQAPVAVKRVLLVAPADPNLLTTAPTFIHEFDLAKCNTILRSQNPTVIASNNDPWLPRGIHETFGTPLGITPIVWEGAAHFSLSDGWGKWSGVFNWCLDPHAELKQR